MAEIGISEFTFGYAFLFEQTHSNWGDLKAAPILPSLQQEEEDGWDARLPLNGTDFYYQFKLSDYLSRGNAKYISDGTYDGPYYRFWLHRRNNSQQHRRLKEHAATNPNTFYVAPQFNAIEEFNSRFLARQITQNCRIISLADCSDVDDAEHHCITFQPPDPAWILHSEPKRREKSFTGNDLGRLYRGSVDEWRPVDMRFAGQLLEKTINLAKRIIVQEEPERANVLRPLLEEGQIGRDRQNLLLRTAEILSATLGITLVIVGSVPDRG